MMTGCGMVGAVRGLGRFDKGRPVGVVLGACVVAAAAAGQTPPGASTLPTYEAPVREPGEGEAAIAKKKEHCSADAAHLATIGRAVGQQVRVSREGGESGLFTVMKVHAAAPGKPTLGIGRLGRLRLGSTEPFEAVVSPDVTHSHLTDAEALARGDFVERLDDDGRNTALLVMAPHGGDLVRPTDLQAERVAALLGKDRTTLWRCRGYAAKGGRSAFERWHITSTEIHEASFPLLGSIAGRKFDHAVSFHGMADRRILVGGGGPARLKVEIRDAIRAAINDPAIPVDIALPGETNGGTSPANIVNRYAKGTGIQIEQSPQAREKHWERIAEAVAGVYRAHLDAAVTGPGR